LKNNSKSYVFVHSRTLTFSQITVGGGGAGGNGVGSFVSGGDGVYGRCIVIV